jgi:drug/metabolite transporter (DMT)-like permease
VHTASLNATLAAVYLGIFPAATVYVLWAYALSKVNVSRVTSSLNLQPVLSLAIALLLLGEMPTMVALAGGAITIAGVIVLNTIGKGRRTERT